MDMNIRSERIRELRLQRAWSQEHLAEVTSLGLRTIQRMETLGTGSYESLRSIAAVFNLDVRELIQPQLEDKPSVSPVITNGQFRILAAGLALVALVVSVLYLYLVRPSHEQGVGAVESSLSRSPEGEAGTIAPLPVPERSIAVLPFVNFGSDPEQENFSDSLTEELINLLSQDETLHVAARSASFNFKGSSRDIPTIGEALSVNYLLEGSVRRSGDRLRVTVQLIRTDNGKHLWSQTYDKTIGDILVIQDEIAWNVSRALNL